MAESYRQNKTQNQIHSSLSLVATRYQSQDFKVGWGRSLHARETFCHMVLILPCWLWEDIWVIPVPSLGEPHQWWACRWFRHPAVCGKSHSLAFGPLYGHWHALLGPRNKEDWDEILSWNLGDWGEQVNHSNVKSTYTPLKILYFIFSCKDWWKSRLDVPNGWSWEGGYAWETDVLRWIWPSWKACDINLFTVFWITLLCSVLSQDNTELSVGFWVAGSIQKVGA